MRRPRRARFSRLPPELLFGTGLFDRVHCRRPRLLSQRAGRHARGRRSRAGSNLRIGCPSAERPERSCGRQLPAVLARTDARRRAVATSSPLVLRENDDVVPTCARNLRTPTRRRPAAEVAKGRFLAAVSHELRTPLNAIIGFSDMLLHEMFGAFKDPRQKEYVGLVRDSGHHLLAVVTSILDVSQDRIGRLRDRTGTVPLRRRGRHVPVDDAAAGARPRTSTCRRRSRPTSARSMPTAAPCSRS